MVFSFINDTIIPTYLIILISAVCICSEFKSRRTIGLFMIIFTLGPPVRHMLGISSNSGKDYYLFYCMYELFTLAVLVASSGFVKKSMPIYAIQCVSFNFNFALYHFWGDIGLFLYDWYGLINRFLLESTIIALIREQNKRGLLAITVMLIFTPYIMDLIN